MLIEQPPKSSNTSLAWVLHMDGASNLQESETGLILINLEGVVTEYVLHFLFKMTNNQSEYEALLADLKLAKEFGVWCLRVFTNL